MNEAVIVQTRDGERLNYVVIEVEREEQIQEIFISNQQDLVTD